MERERAPRYMFGSPPPAAAPATDVELGLLHEWPPPWPPSLPPRPPSLPPRSPRGDRTPPAAAAETAAAETAAAALSQERKAEAPRRPEPAPRPRLGDPSRRLALDPSPLEAVACNDAHRHADAPDGPDADLWTVDQWRSAAEAARPYRFPVATFVPRPWPAARLLTQADYAQAFDRRFPGLGPLFEIEGVYAAGGAAAWPLGNQRESGDVDLFLVGLDAADRRALWGKVAEVAGALRRAAGDRQVVEVLAPGTVTFLTSERPRLFDSDPPADEDMPLPRKVQVILRVFRTVSAVLHGFDVPACSVAYDGRVAYMTRLAAYAHAFRANVVNPAYRSTTYESRLAKYFARGYALALPALAPEAFAVPVLRLPHLALRIATARGPFAAGALEPDPKAAARGASDYEPRLAPAPPPRRRNRFGFVASKALKAGQAWTNIYQLAAGGSRFVLKGYYLDDAAAGVSWWRPRPQRGLDFEAFGGPGGEPGLDTILPADVLDSHLRRAARAAVGARGRLGVRALASVFGLADAEIARVAAAVRAADASGRQASAAQGLEQHVRALLNRHATAAADPIQWWIAVDPSRQYTGSLNPRCEDPAQWYGAAFAGEGGPARIGPSDQLEALIAALAEVRGEGAEGGGGGPVYDGTCALCLGPLTQGSLNSTTLGCGHVFHWGSGASGPGGCPGLLAWARMNETCPMCRQAFGKERGGPTVPPPLALEW